MGTRLRTSVHSLQIKNGVREEQPGSVGISEDSSIIPVKYGRGNVYVLVETVGGFPEPSHVEQRIIAIMENCCQMPGSITTGIRSAIKEANAFLFEKNLNAPREERGIAGVTCVVLKDRDAFVGQCGPAALYHVGKGQLKRLPEESTWLASETLQDVDVTVQPPLGLRRQIEPDLTHLYVREGDVLILASTSLAKMAGEEEMGRMALYGGAQNMGDNLEGLARGRDFCALMVELLAVDQTSMPIEEEEWEGPATVEEASSVWARASAALRGRFLPSAEGQADIEDDWDGAGPSTGAYAEGEVRSRLPSFDLSAVMESFREMLSAAARGMARLLSRVLPETEPGQRIWRSRASAGAAKDARRAEAKKAAGLDKRWLWAALLIPVVVALLFVVTRLQYERARQAEFRELVSAFEEAKTTAEMSHTADEKRTALASAMAFLADALEIEPDSEELLAEQATLESSLDRVNQVSRIFYFGELQEFVDTEDATSQPSRVLVQGIDVFVLDRGTDRVYKYLLNDTRDALQPLQGDQVLLRQGDVRDEVVVGQLFDICWVGAGGLRGTSNLLTVDRQGQVLQYDPLVGVQPLPVADSSGWGEPVAVAGYVGRLYVLDPATNQVLRYVLTNNGYDGPPTNYFEAETVTDLRDAVDIAIDGNLYILRSTGTISKYEEGSDALFTQSNLDKSISNPTSIFVTGFMDEDGYVYVADAGNQRIVQFSKTGEFVRQYLSGDPSYMNDLRGIFVDEVEKQLFLLNGKKLYVAHFPE
jgi:hypothetical protein